MRRGSGDECTAASPKPAACARAGQVSSHGDNSAEEHKAAGGRADGHGQEDASLSALQAA